jgi:putative phosphoribosyl transferase
MSISVGNITLKGTLSLPKDAKGIVIFAHGSGSSRHSPRNRHVAEVLNAKGLATLLFDLLTREEELIDRRTSELRFDISLLAERLIDVTQWVSQNSGTMGLAIGYFGASTGAAAAFLAAARIPNQIAAVVSRGGRPDLAAEALGSVRASTLLIVGGLDELVITLNRQALGMLKCPNKQLIIVPGATHLFEEPGTLEQVAKVAAKWLDYFLGDAGGEKEDDGFGVAEARR